MSDENDARAVYFGNDTRRLYRGYDHVRFSIMQGGTRIL